MTLPNRKAEAEVKSMQSALDALQRSKKEVESATTRKEKEIQALTDKLNCEQTNLSKSNKQVKECGVRMHLQSKQNIQSGPSKASYSTSRTATGMDRTLYTDFRKSETSGDIKKYS